METKEFREETSESCRIQFEFELELELSRAARYVMVVSFVSVCTGKRSGKLGNSSVRGDLVIVVSSLSNLY